MTLTIQANTPTVEGKRPCPRCRREGIFIADEPRFSSLELRLAKCPDCRLMFTNIPVVQVPPTGIEYLDRYFEVVGGVHFDPRFSAGAKDFESQEEFFEAVERASPFHAYELRRELVQEYAWAIPSPQALRAIAEHGPIVEIGAGGGYWAMLLREQGVDVLAYDSAPYRNHWVSKKWTEVKVGGPSTLKRVTPKRALFLCWPPYSQSMASDCLRAFRGDTVIYVGEGSGGCTGNDRFHYDLNKRWEEIEDVAIPRWSGIHDYLSVWRRK